MEIARILKMIWLVSFIGVNITLFYVFAGLPEMVAFSGDDNTSIDYIDKDLFFYFFLAVIGVLNVLIYVLASKGIGLKNMSSYKMYRLVGWEYGMAIVINIFLAISMFFINIFNSGEKFEYSNFGYLVYFSLGLVILWVLSLPFVIYSARIRV